MTTTTLEPVPAAELAALPAEASLPSRVARAESGAAPRHTIVRRWDDLPLRAKGIAVIAIPLIPLFVASLLELSRQAEV